MLQHRIPPMTPEDPIYRDRKIRFQTLVKQWRETPESRCLSGLIALIGDGLDCLRASPNTIGDDIPTDLETEEMILGATLKKAVKEDRIQFLQNPRKGSPDLPYWFLSAIRWHNSGGSLWSPYPWEHNRKGSAAAKAETVYQVISVITGKQSRALAAWHRAFYGE